jgi:hypothetical protein
MRRTLLMGSVAGVVALAGVLTISLTYLTAQPKNATHVDPSTAKPGTASLPISQVVLFSSGVGYFQREGDIEGDASVDLTFPVTDINDLLKSMVLQDLSGGAVSAVSYDSHDPVEKTLKSFAINLNGNPSFGNILNQARGEKVELVLQQTNLTQPGTLTGTIVGMEKQRQPAGKDAFIESEMLNLWCADGMRCVKLSDVQRLRFLNPVIDNEFKRALETLALSHDTQKKSVSLRFNGEGKRPVRVSYVVESPIWKTSYRLVLGKNGKPFLQGWAVVENTSDSDWNNVRMALVSGRPISFQMDLYSPLYVPRPIVEPELFASLRPQTYSGNMLNDYAPASRTPALADAEAKPHNRPEELKKLEKNNQQSLAFGMNVNGALVRGGDGGGMGGRIKERLGESLAVDRGVASAATATEMGDFFQYFIEKPVNLPRQKSAMLPIVNQNVEGTRVSIYNEATHAKFPLLGLKLKNTSGLHLMQGPITVFDGSSYAGDARIMDLQPNEERLLSYAIDLGMEVEPVVESDADKLIAVKVVKGIIYMTHKLRESRKWNIKNRTEQDRTLVIEHPYRQEFKLVTPKEASERSRDVYRFELKVPAGKSAKQEVVEEQDLVQAVQLSNSNDESIKVLLSNNVTSPKVKSALEKAMNLRQQWATTQRDLARMNEDLKQITEDQTRLRANLREMPPTAAAYKRYLEKFDRQETDIERLQEQIKKLQATEHEQRKAYESYLANLEVE